MRTEEPPQAQCEEFQSAFGVDNVQLHSTDRPFNENMDHKVCPHDKAVVIAPTMHLHQIKEASDRKVCVLQPPDEYIGGWQGRDGGAAVGSRSFGHCSPSDTNNIHALQPTHGVLRDGQRNDSNKQKNSVQQEAAVTTDGHYG